MSLTCSRADIARYFALTSSNRRRTTRMATATTSGSATIDERWVALNKSTFLDILNEILSQSAITTPEMTSQVSIEDRSPEYVCMDDQPSISGRTTQMNWVTLFSNDYSSGLPRYSAYTTTSPFARCRQLTECKPVNIRAAGSEWNDVNSKSQSLSTSSLPAQRLSPDMEVATDLTTVDRRRPQPRHSTEQLPYLSSISFGHRPVNEATNIYHSLFERRSEIPESVEEKNICLQSLERSSPSANVVDDRTTTTSLTSSQDASDIDEVCDELQQQLSSSSVTLSPYYFNTASTTGVTNQSPSSCCSVSNDRNCTFGTNAEVRLGEPRASWIVIDKTLLYDVVDHVLYHDIFCFPERQDTTFPFLFDSYFTGSRSDSWSHSEKMMMASTQQRFLHDDMLYSLLKSDSPRPEPETPQRSPATSSLYWHHTGSNNKGYRLKKRSTHGTIDLSGKRHCRDSDCRNVIPFPMYVKTQNDDINCSDDDGDDNRTPGNTAHSPSLKWKSTMLLRMRTETETPGSCSPVTAAT